MCRRHEPGRGGGEVHLCVQEGGCGGVVARHVERAAGAQEARGAASAAGARWQPYRRALPPLCRPVLAGAVSFIHVVAPVNVLVSVCRFMLV